MNAGGDKLPQMVRAILFDLDGTLWDRDRAFQELSVAQHDTYAELAVIPREHYVARAVQLDDHGVGDKQSVYSQIVAEFNLPPKLSGVLFDHFSTAYSSFFEPFPEVLSTLRSLKAGGVKLGIITNGAIGPQESKIAGLGLLPLMDTILISEREGVRKPQKEIFNRALMRLGVEASSAWFVGDHPDADIRGASEAGLTAVWRKTWGQAPHAHHTINALDELIPLLVAPEP